MLASQSSREAANVCLEKLTRDANCDLKHWYPTRAIDAERIIEEPRRFVSFEAVCFKYVKGEV